MIDSMFVQGFRDVRKKQFKVIRRMLEHGLDEMGWRHRRLRKRNHYFLRTQGRHNPYEIFAVKDGKMTHVSVHTRIRSSLYRRQLQEYLDCLNKNSVSGSFEIEKSGDLAYMHTLYRDFSEQRLQRQLRDALLRMDRHIRIIVRVGYDGSMTAQEAIRFER